MNCFTNLNEGNSDLNLGIKKSKPDSQAKLHVGPVGWTAESTAHSAEGHAKWNSTPNSNQLIG